MNIKSIKKKTLVLCRPVQTCVIGQSILPSKNDTSAVKYAYNYQALKKKKANLHIWIIIRLLDRAEEEEEEERTSMDTRVTLLCNCVILSKSRTLR